MQAFKLLAGLLAFTIGFCLGVFYRMRWVLLIAALIYIVVQATN